MSTAPDSSSPTVSAAAGGYEGLLRLAEAWHARVIVDEVVGHAFSHGFHPQHTERLAGYWAEALGGPALYTDSYGDETLVVRMHSGNGPHDEIECAPTGLVYCTGKSPTPSRTGERIRSATSRPELPTS
jgi:hypothetical protein